jgi:Glycosyl transferase family 2
MSEDVSTGRKIRILLITHDRPEYTRMTLERLCGTISGNTLITVWDNASGNETVELLKQFQGHKSVERIIFNKTNDKLRGPTNWFWNQTSDADYVGKVDDDCLMPPDWCETLIKAHEDIADLGVIGCWQFFDEDFDFELAKRKIQAFGRHQIMRNCWVGGSGYLMKRAVLNKLGCLGPQESFTDYCIRGATAGFINGWYYPFLFQEHLDDPRSLHTGIKTDEDFVRFGPLTAKTFNVQTREEWIQSLKHIARHLQVCSYDPKHYVGWKAWMKMKLCRLLGRSYCPIQPDSGRS